MAVEIGKSQIASLKDREQGGYCSRILNMLNDKTVNQIKTKSKCIIITHQKWCNIIYR